MTNIIKTLDSEVKKGNTIISLETGAVISGKKHIEMLQKEYRRKMGRDELPIDMSFNEYLDKEGDRFMEVNSFLDVLESCGFTITDTETTETPEQESE